MSLVKWLIMLAGTEALLIGFPGSGRAQELADDPPASLPGDAAEAENTGQDETDPVRRIDVRMRYTARPNDAGSQQYVLRSDRPIELGNGDKITLRFDVPFVANDQVSPDNPLGKDDIGLGDILFQLTYSHPVREGRGFVIGARLVAPTAKEDRFGRDKWVVAPILGYRWKLPCISSGSYFGPTLRYEVSVGGNAFRQDVDVLRFSPAFNFDLTAQVFITLFPSADIQYDFIDDSFFLPVNAMIGKLWQGGVLTSVEGSIGVVDDENAPYDWKVEARVGFFF